MMRKFERLHRFMEWARITDEHDRNVSLTSLGMWIALAKFAFLKSFTLPELSAFFLALAAYAYKAHRRAHAITADHEARLAGVAELVDKVKDKVQKLENRGAVGR